MKSKLAFIVLMCLSVNFSFAAQLEFKLKSLDVIREENPSEEDTRGMGKFLLDFVSHNQGKVFTPILFAQVFHQEMDEFKRTNSFEDIFGPDATTPKELLNIDILLALICTSGIHEIIDENSLSEQVDNLGQIINKGNLNYLAQVLNAQGNIIVPSQEKLTKGFKEFLDEEGFEEHLYPLLFDYCDQEVSLLELAEWFIQQTEIFKNMMAPARNPIAGMALWSFDTFILTAHIVPFFPEKDKASYLVRYIASKKMGKTLNE